MWKQLHTAGVVVWDHTDELSNMSGTRKRTRPSLQGGAQIFS
jgi:hypothetical protein